MLRDPPLTAQLPETQVGCGLGPIFCGPFCASYPYLASSRSPTSNTPQAISSSCPPTSILRPLSRPRALYSDLPQDQRKPPRTTLRSPGAVPPLWHEAKQKKSPNASLYLLAIIGRWGTERKRRERWVVPLWSGKGASSLSPSPHLPLALLLG